MIVVHFESTIFFSNIFSFFPYFYKFILSIFLLMGSFQYLFTILYVQNGNIDTHTQHIVSRHHFYEKKKFQCSKIGCTKSQHKSTYIEFFYYGRWEITGSNENKHKVEMEKYRYRCIAMDFSGLGATIMCSITLKFNFEIVFTHFFFCFLFLRCYFPNQILASS